MGGHKFNLQSARKSNTDYTGSDGLNTYIMNFCGPTVSNPDCGGMCCEMQGQAVKFVTIQGDQPPEESFLDPSDYKKGSKLSYEDGDTCYHPGFPGKRFAVVSLKCSETSDTTFTVTQNPQCTFTLEMNLKEACDGSGSSSLAGGLSVGSIILITLVAV